MAKGFFITPVDSNINSTNNTNSFFGESEVDIVYTSEAAKQAQDAQEAADRAEAAALAAEQVALDFGLIDDQTPQLGGILDVNGFAITSSGEDNLVINTDGTGFLQIEQTKFPKGAGVDNQVLVSDSSSQLIWTTVTDLTGTKIHSVNEDNKIDTQGPSGEITLITPTSVTIDAPTGLNLKFDTPITSDANIILSPTSNVILDKHTWPNSDGSDGQLLMTNGLGHIGFVNNADAILKLSDTPTNYTGSGNKLLSVNSAEEGITFIDPPLGPITQIGGYSDKFTPLYLINCSIFNAHVSTLVSDETFSFFGVPDGLYALAFTITGNGTYNVNWPLGINWLDKEPRLLQNGEILKVSLETTNKGISWVGMTSIESKQDIELINVGPLTYKPVFIPSIDAAVSNIAIFTVSSDTTVTINNVQDAYYVCEMQITINGINSITWPDNTTWHGNIEPITQPNAEVILVSLSTYDNGANWFGMHSTQPIELIGIGSTSLAVTKELIVDASKFSYQELYVTTAWPNSSSIVIENVPSGRYILTTEIFSNSIRTVTWPDDITWLNGAPELGLTGTITIAELKTVDKGLTWTGFYRQTDDRIGPDEYYYSHGAQQNLGTAWQNVNTLSFTSIAAHAVFEYNISWQFTMTGAADSEIEFRWRLDGLDWIWINITVRDDTNIDARNIVEVKEMLSGAHTIEFQARKLLSTDTFNVNRSVVIAAQKQIL